MLDDSLGREPVSAGPEDSLLCALEAEERFGDAVGAHEETIADPQPFRAGTAGSAGAHPERLRADGQLAQIPRAGAEHIGIRTSSVGQPQLPGQRVVLGQSVAHVNVLWQFPGRPPQTPPPVAGSDSPRLPRD